MYFKKSLILLMTLVTGSIYAQTTTFSNLRDNPENLNNITIKLRPWYADIAFGQKVDGNEVAAVNGSMGYGFDILVNPLPILNDKLSMVLRYRKSYFDFSDIALNQEQVRGTHFELGGSWELFSNRRKVKGNIILDEQRKGQSKEITSVDDVERTRLTRFMIDAGMFRSSYPMTIEGPGFESYRIIASTTGLYSGFKFSRSMNYEAAFSGYGIGGDAIRSSFYAHFMYAPKINYSDVIVSGDFAPNGPDVETHLDTNNAIPNVGARLGLEVDLNPSKWVQYSFITELGYRPPLNGFYVFLGASVTVNFNIRPNTSRS